jgi:hypothetical protein
MTASTVCSAARGLTLPRAPHFTSWQKTNGPGVRRRQGVLHQDRGEGGAVQKRLIGWQKKDGNWPIEGMAATNPIAKAANPDYPTAIATLTLFIPDGRLSIFNRTPPKLPRKNGAKKE